jgi:hypothetical protein
VPAASDWPRFWVLPDRLSSCRAILSSVVASWRSHSSLVCRYTLAALVEEWPIRFISSASEGARLTGEGVAGMTEIVNMNLSR